MKIIDFEASFVDIWSIIGEAGLQLVHLFGLQIICRHVMLICRHASLNSFEAVLTSFEAVWSICTEAVWIIKTLLIICTKTCLCKDQQGGFPSQQFICNNVGG